MNAASIYALCRSRGKSALRAMGIGVVASAFYGAAQWPKGFASILFIGAIIGLTINVAISILDYLFGRFIERLGSNGRAIAYAVIFVAGGAIGGAFGIVGGTRLLGHEMSVFDVLEGRGIPFVITAGVTALVVGVGFRAYESMSIGLARTIEQLKEREWAEKELVLARSIQTRLLPPAHVQGDGYAISARNLPANFVAGDFYDIVRLDDGTVVIVVADVAGKGVGASLIMASVKAVLPFVAREGAQHAMSMLNEKLVNELGKREFVALAYARFHPHDGSLEILNAGFPDPYLISGHDVRPLVATGERLPLGLRADARYEPLHANIAHGERLVFVSDGIPEAPLAAPLQGEPLGYERVASILGAMNGSLRGEAWLDRFLGDVRAVVDNGLADDWTAVVVERA